MAAALTLRLVSMDEYFKRGMDREFEYVDGRLAERNVGNPLHARLAARLVAALVPLSDKYGFVVYDALTIHLSRTRHRVPDVCIYLTDQDFDDNEIPSRPPALVFEILSPGDEFDELMEKFEDYATLGVQQILLLVARRRKVMYPDAGSLVALPSPVTLILGQHSSDFDFERLFNQL